VQCPMAGSAGTWSLKFDFFGVVDPEKSKWSVGTRDVSFVFMRKSAGAFWDKLNKGAKLTTLKCDWDKWKDEDDNQVSVMQQNCFHAGVWAAATLLLSQKYNEEFTGRL
jgi:hypothetical protein